MGQYDGVIEMLSERRAGSKLKRITYKPAPIPNHTLISFYFEGEEENEERVIGIFGEDIQVSFGRIRVD